MKLTAFYSTAYKLDIMLLQSDLNSLLVMFIYCYTT